MAQGCEGLVKMAVVCHKCIDQMQCVVGFLTGLIGCVSVCSHEQGLAIYHLICTCLVSSLHLLHHISLRLIVSIGHWR